MQSLTLLIPRRSANFEEAEEAAKEIEESKLQPPLPLLLTDRQHRVVTTTATLEPAGPPRLQLRARSKEQPARRRTRTEEGLTPTATTAMERPTDH